jgi:hypothetical protein
MIPLARRRALRTRGQDAVLLDPHGMSQAVGCEVDLVWEDHVQLLQQRAVLTG